MDPNNPEVIRSRDFYIRLGHLDYRTNPYILPDLRPLPDIANINYIDRQRAERLFRDARRAIGLTIPNRHTPLGILRDERNYAENVYNSYYLGTKISKPETPFNSSSRNYLAARNRAIAEYNRILDELLALPIVRPVVQLVIQRPNIRVRDPVSFLYWFRLVFGTLPTRSNIARVRTKLMDFTGYTVREDDTDFFNLRLPTVKREFITTVRDNIEAYNSNLEIIRNILRRPYVEGVRLMPRTRVTVRPDVYMFQDIILGENARDRGYDNMETLIQVGLNRFRRDLDEVEGLPETDNFNEQIARGARIARLRRYITDLTNGMIPEDEHIGIMDNESIIRIMADVYRQLVGADSITIELVEVRNESAENTEIVREFTVRRPNIYTEINEENRAVFGYFPYELPENNFGFNIRDDSYCTVTSIIENPLLRMPKLVDREMFVAYIYGMAGIRIYEGGLVDRKYFIHDAIARALDISFVVEYFVWEGNGRNRRGEKVSCWKGHRRRYPGMVEIKKKDIIETETVFRVLEWKRHLFNVNNDEAFEFLKAHVRTNLPLREGYEDEAFRGRCEIFWSDILVRICMKELEKEPKHLWKQLIMHEDKIIGDDELSKDGGYTFIEKDRLEASELKEVEEKVLSYPLFVCLDFEASGRNAYSMSFNYFTNDGLIEGYEKTYNITITTGDLGINSRHMTDFIRATTAMATLVGATIIYVEIHNGGGYDWPVVMEDIIMKTPEVILGKPIFLNKKLIDMSFTYDNFTFKLRDSYKLTTKSLSDLGIALGIDGGKQKFMYKLYNEIYNINKPYRERKLIWTHNELMTLLDTKNEEWRDEIIGFLREYGEKEEYNLVEIVVEYCNSDVILLRKCLIRFMELMGDSSNENSFARKFKSLNSNYIGYKIDEKDKKKFIEYINPLTKLTLPNIINTIAKNESCFVRIHKLKGSLNKYISRGVRGGRCLIHLRRKFVSNIINRIVDNPYFYVTDEELISNMEKHGYNRNKERIYYDPGNPPVEVISLIDQLRQLGGCLVDLDAVSLYPSAIYNIKWFPAGRPYILTQDIVNATRPERGIQPEDKIWYGNFRFRRTPTDKVWSTIKGWSVEFPLFTKKDKWGKTIPIDMSEEYYPMNIVDYKEFRKYYPNAEITLVDGVYFDEKCDKFSEFTRELYCKRAYYKRLEKSNNLEERSLGKMQEVVKLMLNSLYGSMIRKETETETVYASKRSYARIEKKIMNRLNSIFKTSEDIIRYCDGVPLVTDQRLNELNQQIHIILSTFRPCDNFRNRLNLCDQRKELMTFIIRNLPDRYKLNDVEMIKRDQVGVETYGFEIESPNYTHKLTYRKKTKHQTMPHCGSLLLSYSKAIMNMAGEAVGWAIYLTDTDSMHVDGSLMMKPEVRALLDPVDLTEAERNALYPDGIVPETSMGKFHSDFNDKWWGLDNEIDGWKYSVIPLDKMVGLCSIETWIVDKKFYCDTIFGQVIMTNIENPNIKRAYLGIHLHRKAKGFKADLIQGENWEGLVKGTEGLAQNLLKTKGMAITNDRNKGVIVKTTENGDAQIKSYVAHNIRHDKNAVKKWKAEEYSKLY